MDRVLLTKVHGTGTRLVTRAPAAPV